MEWKDYNSASMPETRGQYLVELTPSKEIVLETWRGAEYRWKNYLDAGVRRFRDISDILPPKKPEMPEKIELLYADAHMPSRVDPADVEKIKAQGRRVFVVELKPIREL